MQYMSTELALLIRRVLIKRVVVNASPLIVLFKSQQVEFLPHLKINFKNLNLSNGFKIFENI